MRNFDAVVKTVMAVIVAATSGILVTASAVLGIIVLEALTGLHLAATIVAALIGLGHALTVWGWLQK